MENELIKQLAELNDKYLEVKKENDYWKNRCQLAEDCLEKSPCDQDITTGQIEAWKKYHAFIKQFGIKLITNP